MTERDNSTVLGVYYTSFSSGNGFSSFSSGEYLFRRISSILVHHCTTKVASSHHLHLLFRRLANIRDSALPHLSHKSAPYVSGRFSSYERLQCISAPPVTPHVTHSRSQSLALRL